MHAHVTTFGKRILLGLMLAGGVLLASSSFAETIDLPTAPASPIAGIGFDDPPLVLPIQRNFQMAMLLASSELGRSCGKMEAYGWRVAENEQQRVNQIFNNTVDRLRAQGFSVEAKTAQAVSRDVTLFTADRNDKHMIFLWSAGEIGLAMVLCETSAPLSPIPENILKKADAAQALAMPTPLATMGTLANDKIMPPPSSRTTRAGRPVFEDFSPVGNWVGSYTCAQGTTGATLSIKKLKGDQFEGSFKFYPTTKNPYVPRGEYLVFGQYDADSMRILLNPGKWIERPKDYYNTIIIGSFDPVGESFSGFFQGIMGCTSIEAHLARGEKAQAAAEKALAPKKAAKPAEAAKPALKKKARKKTAKPKVETIPVAPAAETAPAPLTEPKAAAPAPEPVAPPPPSPDKAKADPAPSPAGISIGGPSNP